MTALTPASLLPQHVNLGLNLLGRHRLTGKGVQLAEHSPKILAGALAPELLV